MGSEDPSVGSGTVKYTVLPEVEGENSRDHSASGRYGGMAERGRKGGLLRMVSLSEEEQSRNQPNSSG